MITGGDHNKPYYSTIKSSSEGEISSGDEESKTDMLNKVLPTPSEDTEVELRRKLLKGRKDNKDSNRSKHQDHTKRSPGRHRDDRSKDHSRRDRHHRSKSPSSKKRPAIKAPSPERKEKYRQDEGSDRRNDLKSKKHANDELVEQVIKIAVEEHRIEHRLEIQKRMSTNSTPTFSDSPSPKDDSPMNLHVKALAGQQRSNTGSPMPGSNKYSRFDSPEPEDTDLIPEQSIEMHLSSEEGTDEDTEKPVEAEPMLIENVTMAQSKKFEELTDEEKGLLSPEELKKKEEDYQKRLIAQLPVYYPGIYGCRSINEFRLLNRISEGTFGVVFRAVEKNTDEVVALKQLKMEKEKEGFPITSLREINMLMKCRNHANVVGLREIVTDATGEKIYMCMEFVEHDLRALMKQLEARHKRFKLAEVKTLMQQLLSGIAHMHSEWVIHRDLKTANLLLSHNNILKIGDFGLAREYGDPLKAYTSLVVTLHYRSPELLLGCKTYSTAVDMWSIGCIFGEFFKLNAIFPGTSEGEQVKLIFDGIGTPNEKIWPGYNDLQYVNKFNWPNYPPGQLRKRFFKDLNESKVGLDLMTRLLHPCPKYRISAEESLEHEWFKEDPLPAPSESLPTWPAKSENLKNPPRQPDQPKPQQQSQPSIDPERLKLLQEFNIKPTKSVANAGFSLKLGR